MRTFIIIKPDAIHRGLIGKIISRFEDACFEISGIRLLHQDKAWFAAMYPHLKDTFVRLPMQDFMLSRPLVGIVLNGYDAVTRVRLMVGRTDSTQAKPGTIRGDYGNSPIRFNCVHASDSQEAVSQEIALFFGDNDG